MTEQPPRRRNPFLVEPEPTMPDGRAPGAADSPGAEDQRLGSVRSDVRVGDAAAAGGSWLPVLLSVAMNAVTLLGVVVFGWPPGNVFLLFWIENAVLGLCSLVKVATAAGAPGSRSTVRFTSSTSSRTSRAQLGRAGTAVFFAFHYGIFCVVHLVFTGFVAYGIGVDLSFALLGFPAVLILIRYTVETVVSWFGRDGLRWRTSPAQAMAQPYPRIIVLHLSVIAAFIVLISGVTDATNVIGRVLESVLSLLPMSAQTEGVGLVLVLLVIKTAVDVVTTRRAVRPRR